MARRLIPLEQILDEAGEAGINPNYLVADPDDVCEIDPDEILASEENPED